jgi:hypothetical protein
MFSSIVVVGLMAADAGAASAPAASARPAAVAVEISFVTRAGEGAAGSKRFMRDGCYQVESGGSTGGAGYARDSQAGCHLAGDVEAVFDKLAAVAADALVRETPGRASAAGGAPSRGLETRVVLVRQDGSRWVAAGKEANNQLLGAVNELPSENQWYAKPPAKPAGTGAQLLVLAVTTSGRGGSRRLEASLASDGRWWCHRSVVGQPGGDQKLPATKTLTLPAAQAAARLGRILEGARPDAGDDGPPASKRPDRVETSVEIVWPGPVRAPLRPKRLADGVADRFGAEMQALSPACAVTPAPGGP